MRLEHAGLIRAGSGDRYDQLQRIYQETIELVSEHQPGIVVVEQPAIAGQKRTSRDFDEKRSAITLPAYGMAVAAVMCACVECGIRPLEPPSNRWPWKDVPSTRNDEHKVARVRFAAGIFGRQPESFGARTVAGNVADAALLAVWGLNRSEAELALAFDPGIRVTGWAVVRR